MQAEPGLLSLLAVAQVPPCSSNFVFNGFVGLLFQSLPSLPRLKAPSKEPFSRIFNARSIERLFGIVHLLSVPQLTRCPQKVGFIFFHSVLFKSEYPTHIIKMLFKAVENVNQYFVVIP